MPSPRVLFILKRRDNKYTTECPYTSYGYGLSSGLANSVRFCVELLHDLGIASEEVEVIDSNDIHREVVKYKATHAIIEALWVLPSKFAELKKVMPTVTFLVRTHSEIPFLSAEGIAMEWLIGYLNQPVTIAANSLTALHDIRHIARTYHPEWDNEQVDAKVVYLPNYYPKNTKADFQPSRSLKPGMVINIGLFGAIRPLKNSLIQSLAAIKYANAHGLILHLHMNTSRVEGGPASANIVKNIRALFANSKHKLIEYGWLNHEDFVNLISTMDVSLCVSFSETFSIVAADGISLGVPTVVSSEIDWASPHAMASTTDSDSIERAIRVALHPFLRYAGKVLNNWGLRRYCDKAVRAWAKYFGIY